MNDLHATIREVRQKLKDYRPLYERNEKAVRDQLVNPVLRSLEWNPEDPRVVCPDVSTEEGFPDYSLIEHGKTVLMLEAKNLRADIQQEDVLRQLAKYCFNKGTRYGIVSNGALWLLIRSFQEGTSLRDRVLWCADLENDDLSSVCRKLGSILRDTLDQIEGLVAEIRKAEAFDRAWESLVGDPDAIATALFRRLRDLITSEYPECQFEDQEVQDFLGERVSELISRPPKENGEGERDSGSETNEGPGGDRQPRRMKLKDDTFHLSRPYKIRVNTANWLIKNGKLRRSDCPVQVARGKTYLVHTHREHRDGSSFRNAKTLDNGLFIEVHGSTSSHIESARRLLRNFGLGDDLLSIEWS